MPTRIKVVLGLLVAGAMFSFLMVFAHATWRPEFSNNHPNVSAWFKKAELMPAATARLTWVSCCEHADRLMTKVIPMADRDGWMYYTDPNCTWRGCELAEIPQDTIHDDPIPQGKEFEQMRAEGVLFIYGGKVTCFWKPEGGI